MKSHSSGNGNQMQALGRELQSPNAPAPAPVPGPGTLNPVSTPRGEFESTFGVSGTPITGGFLTDLGEYNPELAGRNAVLTYEKDAARRRAGAGDARRLQAARALG